MKLKRDNIGFDIGTSKLRIYQNAKQIIELPTELQYHGKLLNNFIVNGKIAQFNATQLFLRNEIKKIQKQFLGFLSPTFTTLVSVPSDSNEVAIRTFRDTMERAGAKKCFMLNDCFIAATGLEIDLKNSTSMIVDCGAGKTSITTFHGFDIIRNDIYDIAGRNFDDAIRAYLSRQYNLIVDPIVSESLKIEFADFRKNSNIEIEIQITGRDKKTNSIKQITVHSNEITRCMKIDVELFIDKIIRHFDFLENSDSEKVRANGVYLIGGGFKLVGLIDLIADKLSVASKSYNLSSDYMKIGFEKIQSNPDELFEYMMT